MKFGQIFVGFTVSTIIFGSGAFIGKILFVRSIKKSKIVAYFRLG